MSILVNSQHIGDTLFATGTDLAVNNKYISENILIFKYEFLKLGFWVEGLGNQASGLLIGFPVEI